MFRLTLLLAILLFSSNTYTDERTIWQQIREGIGGYSAVNGQESEILIQATGTQWLTIRNELIAGTGAWLIALTVLALALFYLIRGRVKLTEPATGEMIERWSKSERWLHFYTASLFILLALTGLSLLYGRSFLISWLGHDSFSQVADIAKIVHNYAGPLFSVGLVMMGMIWFQDNLFNKTDITWFKQYGGMIGNQHPSAGRMNAGEKAWFWLLMTAGVLVSITGMNLDFPNLGQYRLIMQISHIIHSVSAFLLIIGALGHIYIGTIGTEGALRGIITGKVDKSWARQHHDLWLQQLENSANQKSLTDSENTTPNEQRINL